MAQPSQLTPTEQDALVKQIGLAMLRVAPDDWVQLTIEFRSVGRYSEATGKVAYTDGTTEPWTLPQDLPGLFARLRGGMYREGRGTWFNARYRLDHPSSYNLEYDREEPSWDLPPPHQAYPDDLRLYPRSDDNVPGWLHRRLSSAPPPSAPPRPRFRVARIFDGPGEAVNRPPVSPDEVRELLGYLDGAPLAGPARGYAADRLSGDGRQSVPVAFHTDGTWIWPAAVNYYLREHDVPPEPGLVNHIARRRFELPQVEDSVRSAAAAFLGPGPGGPPGPSGPPGPPPGPPRRPAPGPTQAMPMPPRPSGGPPSNPPGPAGPPPTRVVQPVAQATPPEPAGSAPPAALPSQGPPRHTVETLQNRLTELGVPDSAYRIGAPAGRAWTMEQTDEGWRVGWYDRAFVAPAMFEDVADASAFLLGKLMMDADRGRAAGPAHVVAQFPSQELPRSVPPPPPPLEATQPADFSGLDAFAGGSNGYAQPVGSAVTPRADTFGPGASYGSSDGEFGPGVAPPAVPPPVGPESGGFAPPGGFPPPGGIGTPPGGFGAPPSEPSVPDYGPPDGGVPEPEPESGRHGRHGLPDDEPSNGQHGNGRSTFAQPDSPGFQPESGFAAGSDLPVRRPDPLPVRPQGGSDLERTQFAQVDALLANSPPAGIERPDMARLDSPRSGFQRPEPARLDSPPSGFDRPDRPGGATPPPAAPGSGEWPISPLPGEPPLTLFRGKRLVELEPGMEIDRFGGDDGNLVYAFGTPFRERSLVPEWVERPYRAYRVRRPVQVLTGAAIPWFDQPGGGTAYLLPDAVGELIAQGRLVEIADRERPPD